MKNHHLMKSHFIFPNQILPTKNPQPHRRHSNESSGVICPILNEVARKLAHFRRDLSVALHKNGN